MACAAAYICSSWRLSRSSSSRSLSIASRRSSVGSADLSARDVWRSERCCDRSNAAFLRVRSSSCADQRAASRIASGTLCRNVPVTARVTFFSCSRNARSADPSSSDSGLSRLRGSSIRTSSSGACSWYRSVYRYSTSTWVTAGGSRARSRRRIFCRPSALRNGPRLASRSSPNSSSKAAASGWSTSTG
eukprot:8797-Prymnesium_polylepis.2